MHGVDLARVNLARVDLRVVDLRLVDLRIINLPRVDRLLFNPLRLENRKAKFFFTFFGFEFRHCNYIIELNPSLALRALFAPRIVENLIRTGPLLYSKLDISLAI